MSKLPVILFVGLVVLGLACGRRGDHQPGSEDSPPPTPVGDPEAKAVGVAVSGAEAKGASPRAKPIPEVKENPQPVAAKKAKVPLDRVYSWSGQKGLRPIPKLSGERWDDLYASLDDWLNHTNVTNAFLLVNTDIHAALWATRRVYDPGENVDTIDPDDPVEDVDWAEPKTVWLFLLLGSVDDGESWELLDVEVEANVATVRCRPLPPPLWSGRWPRGQAYWIPLPKPSRSKPYQIVIHDGRSDVPYFTRRVLIR
jgi:hypothetical protein